MVVPFHQVTVGFGKPYARQYNLAGDPGLFFSSGKYNFKTFIGILLTK